MYIVWKALKLFEIGVIASLPLSFEPPFPRLPQSSLRSAHHLLSYKPPHHTFCTNKQNKMSISGPLWLAPRRKSPHAPPIHCNGHFTTHLPTSSSNSLSPLSQKWQQFPLNNNPPLLPSPIFSSQSQKNPNVKSKTPHRISMQQNPLQCSNSRAIQYLLLQYIKYTQSWLISLPLPRFPWVISWIHPSLHFYFKPAPLIFRSQTKIVGIYLLYTCLEQCFARLFFDLGFVDAYVSCCTVFYTQGFLLFEWGEKWREGVLDNKLCSRLLTDWGLVYDDGEVLKLGAGF